jgi:hypothetical protein
MTPSELQAVAELVRRRDAEARAAALLRASHTGIPKSAIGGLAALAFVAGVIAAPVLVIYEPWKKAARR